VRAWERRHGVIEPARTEGKARRYSEADVHRLGLLRAATASGHAIGSIASLSDQALARLAEPGPALADGTIETYLRALARFDAIETMATLEAFARAHPAPMLVLDLLAPLMHEVGERWHEGALSIAEEHLATTQVRQILQSSIAAAHLDPGAPSIVLAAPESHLHDVGLLLGATLAAHRGARPIVLGANLPIAEIGLAIRRAHASVTVIACARDLGASEKRPLRRAVASLAAQHEVWLGVPSGHALASVPGARTFTSLRAFDVALAGRFR
jgi:methanogenic corrinoid protein MtbC1